MLMRRIRYLSKITDQVVCLMSDEHAEAVVWRQDDVDSDSDSLEHKTVPGVWVEYMMWRERSTNLHHRTYERRY